MRIILDNYSNAFTGFTHVFWSGGDIARSRSLEVAKQVGGKTLEMTRLGQYLSSIAYNPELWSLASRNFAYQVPQYGNVYAVLYYPNMVETSIWLTQELPILVRNLVQILFGG